MANKDVSPEKRLLDIIEGKQGNSPAGTALGAGKKLLFPKALQARLSFFRDLLKKKGGSRQRVFIDLKTVNIILQAVIVVIAVGLGIGLKIDLDAIKKGDFFKESNSGAELQAGATEVVSLLQPVDFYLKKVEERDLFRIVTDKKGESGGAFKEPDKTVISKLQEITQTLKLVGISWSNDPDAIIEDTKIQKTYFVKKGYMIDSIMVKEILKDKVILRCQGEEVDLR
ncbi:MAG: hypothetical protein PHO30_00155 [Candidatus Omnitrophica bacterium]|jgi:hypothetical protein|nr:hypothetical protein [Candidatus Omnitrophota bacterium]